nr:uncharacterized protein LOC109729922 isoform X1 [Microcebus murinus]
MRDCLCALCMHSLVSLGTPRGEEDLFAGESLFCSAQACPQGPRARGSPWRPASAHLCARAQLSLRALHARACELGDPWRGEEGLFAGQSLFCNAQAGPQVPRVRPGLPWGPACARPCTFVRACACELGDLERGGGSLCRGIPLLQCTSRSPSPQGPGSLGDQRACICAHMRDCLYALCTHAPVSLGTPGEGRRVSLQGSPSSAMHKPVPKSPRPGATQGNQALGPPHPWPWPWPGTGAGFSRTGHQSACDNKGCMFFFFFLWDPPPTPASVPGVQLVRPRARGILGARLGHGLPSGLRVRDLPPGTAPPSGSRRLSLTPPPGLSWCRP